MDSCCGVIFSYHGIRSLCQLKAGIWQHKNSQRVVGDSHVVFHTLCFLINIYQQPTHWHCQSVLSAVAKFEHTHYVLKTTVVNSRGRLLVHISL